MTQPTYLVMAGGTGGHVYPALATARLLEADGAKLVWMGSQGGMEQGVVTREGIEFRGLSISGLRGKGLKHLALAPFRLLLAVYQAIQVLREVQPDCVLGMGGFASGPGGIAARLLGKPLVIHEQNAIAGMTNRYLAKVANRVLQAFPGAFEANDKVAVTGNPIRAEIAKLYYAADKSVSSQRRVRVLVMGGSLGAQTLNECLPQALAAIDSELRPELMHQTGKNKFASTQTHYQQAGVEVDLREYIEDMSAAYEWADFVICRAGALTVSELCAVGLGAILVPYPYAVDDHQTANAQQMEQAGAAWIVQQSELNPETLADILLPLLRKPKRIEKLAQAARKLAQPDAAEKVASVCRSQCYA